MIKYCYQDEEWYDTEDKEFSVSMTPESEKDCEMEFEYQSEFWTWYTKDIEY